MIVFTKLHLSCVFLPDSCPFIVPLKKNSLCAKYPKGVGELFCQWMMDNHSGELLFHVEISASDVQQDVTSIAAMSIFCIRNYCVYLLDEMISHCGNSENILAHNLMILFSSVDIIAVSRLWSILQISIAMPMRWLAACTHKME